MSEHATVGEISIFFGALARNLLLSGLRGRWVGPGRVPRPLVSEKTHAKLLKRKRLLVYQFD